MKRALVTGSLGQDGSYLCELLLRKRYEVYGTVRMHPKHHDHYVEGVHYEYADVTDNSSLMKLIRKVHPDEIYNLAGQVFVPTSWYRPEETFDANTIGLSRILKILDDMDMKSTRVYQASTSEMFGNVLATGIVALNETHDMNPVSPYGISKLAAHKLVDIYRQRGRFVVSGILFNHESPRRGIEMVTRKITRHVAAWTVGKMDVLKLGSITSKRDWGFAGDFVEAMWLMMQQDAPDDYVIGTGVANSVSDFITTAIDVAGLSNMNIEDVVQSDCKEFTRSPELHALVADYAKAEIKLGWKPKHSFRDLVGMMVAADCKMLQEVVNV